MVVVVGGTEELGELRLKGIDEWGETLRKHRFLEDTRCACF